MGIAYNKNEVISDVIEWFEESVDFLNYRNTRQELRTAIDKTDEVKKLMLNMICEMDLDIEDFRIEEKEETYIEVYTNHTVNGYSTELILAEESSGTRKLFGLLPFIARSLVFRTTLVIDELDAKIHPVLLRYVIMLFNHIEINRNGA